MNVNFPRLRRQALESMIGALKFDMQPHQRKLLGLFISPLASPFHHSFLLPDNGEIISHKTPSRLTMESCRLPFPQCVFEYSNTADWYHIEGKSDRWHPDATILVVEQKEDGGPITTIVAWRSKDGWMPSTHGFLIDDKTLVEVLDTGVVRVDGITPLLADRAYKGREDPREGILNYIDEMRVLAHFVLLCNCENVKPAKLFTPSPALVKRSKERGRLPPNEYWVLDCFLGENQDKPYGQSGSHASPRFHVRREIGRAHV